MSFAVCYVPITRFMFLLFVLCLFSCFIYFAFSLCFLCFLLFCVLFFILYMVVSFLSMYRFTDYCHRVETQFHLLNIVAHIRSLYRYGHKWRSHGLQNITREWRTREIVFVRMKRTPYLTPPQGVSSLVFCTNVECFYNRLIVSYGHPCIITPSFMPRSSISYLSFTFSD